MMSQVLEARDQLAQMLYANVFDQIVHVINKSLGDLHCASEEDQADYARATVVDPPGFEHLEPVYVSPRDNKDISARQRRRRKGKMSQAFSPGERAWHRAATTFRAENAFKNAFSGSSGHHSSKKEDDSYLEAGLPPF